MVGYIVEKSTFRGIGETLWPMIEGGGTEKQGKYDNVYYN